jgi:DNA-binding PadR family transcriptional regulator
MPFRPRESELPLTPISFEILLALLDEPQHGYAILQVVDARAGSLLPMRTGTVYRALGRLMDEGLITEADAAGAAADRDERRRTYRITVAGRKIARAEAERLASQVAAARARRLLPSERTGRK